MSTVQNHFLWTMKSTMPSSNFGYRSDGEKIFDRIAPVQIQVASNDDRKHLVRLTVEYVQAGIATSSFRKELHMEITDEEDPYVFYTLRMTEEDFSVLKSQQGLLVDFSSFPSKFVQLVERCIAESETDFPKFLVVLRSATEMSKSHYLLEIVETNPFKHLCHLSLKMTEGTETQIKNHLSKKLRQLKEQKDEALLALQAAQQQIEAERKSHSQRGAELEHLRCDLQKRLEDADQRLRLESQSEKSALLQARCDIEQQLKLQQRDAADRESRLRQQLGEVNERQRDTELTVKDLKSKLVKSEEECSRLQQELLSGRRRSASMESDLHNKEKALNHLRTKLAVVEQELKDKDMLLSKQQDLLTAAQEQKDRLSKMLEEKTNVISRRESAVKAMTEELIKANDIIRKLQSEIKSTTSKLKMRTEVASEQERILGEKEDEMRTLRESLQSFANLRVELEQLKSREEEKDKTIKSNEQVITYLNKQLNELEVNRDKVVTPWFSTPNDADASHPNIALSTVRRYPLQMASNVDRENDEPLDPKYFQPKTPVGIVRKDKSKERGAVHQAKPSAYFKK